MYEQMHFFASAIRSAVALLFVAVVVLLPVDRVHAQDQTDTYTGRLEFVWGDLVTDGQVTATTVSAKLVTEAGAQIPLEISPELMAGVGATALQGATVEARGQEDSAGLVHVQSLTPKMPVGAVGDTVGDTVGGAAVLPVSGSQPWIVLLCRGAGAGIIHDDPLPYYNAMLGTGLYGLDHFWRELSYGKVNLLGSASAGWLDLPEPASAYQDGPDYNRALLLDKAARHCTAAADPTVDFSLYKGVILIVPLPTPDGPASTWFFGGITSIPLEGEYRVIRAVWMPVEVADDHVPNSAGANVILHEMGHGFGLPHSSGPYEDIYDSKWDMMSMSGAGTCYPYDPAVKYGCPDQHTIAPHKEWLGWLDADQILTLADKSSAEVFLSRLALPEKRGVMMIKAPIAGASRYYTVEARQMYGYDTTLKDEAVIIHEVDLSRIKRTAQVVDPDGNGNPNDEGAQWEPGERFDGEGGFTLCVKGRTPQGYIVAASRNKQLDCAFRPDLSPSHYQTNSLYPSAGQTVTVQIELLNYQAPATNVVVTATLPYATNYISGTATTTQGEVSAPSPDQLVFTVGTLTYASSITLSYDVVIAEGVMAPTVITHRSAVVWDQGVSNISMVTIANPLLLHLPILRR